MIRRLFWGQAKYKRIVGICTLEILFFLLCITCIIRHASSDNVSRPEAREECYISIQVHSGDSLWEISRRYYTSDYKSMDYYINKIKALNHMSGESITAGASLIIPYYK